MIFLDTNIWYNYFASLEKTTSQIKKNFLKNQREALEIVKLIKEGKVECCITNFALMEIYSVIKTVLINSKLLYDGFLPGEFGRAKAETDIQLPKESTGFLNNFVYEEIKNMCKFDDVEIDYNFLNRFLKKCGLDVSDAVLLYQANKMGCEYFITTDNNIIKTAEKLKNLKKPKLKIKAIKPKEFLPKHSI